LAGNSYIPRQAFGRQPEWLLAEVWTFCHFYGDFFEVTLETGSDAGHTNSSSDGGDREPFAHTSDTHMSSLLLLFFPTIVSKQIQKAENYGPRDVLKSDQPPYFVLRRLVDRSTFRTTT
jgi:hypothetical protein